MSYASRAKELREQIQALERQLNNTSVNQFEKTPQHTPSPQRLGRISSSPLATLSPRTRKAAAASNFRASRELKRSLDRSSLRETTETLPGPSPRSSFSERREEDLDRTIRVDRNHDDMFAEQLNNSKAEVPRLLQFSSSPTRRLRKRKNTEGKVSESVRLMRESKAEEREKERRLVQSMRESKLFDLRRERESKYKVDVRSSGGEKIVEQRGKQSLQLNHYKDRGTLETIGDFDDDSSSPTSASSSESNLEEQLAEQRRKIVKRKEQYTYEQRKQIAEAAYKKFVRAESPVLHDDNEDGVESAEDNDDSFLQREVERFQSIGNAERRRRYSEEERKGEDQQRQQRRFAEEGVEREKKAQRQEQEQQRQQDHLRRLEEIAEQEFKIEKELGEAQLTSDDDEEVNSNSFDSASEDGEQRHGKWGKPIIPFKQLDEPPINPVKQMNDLDEYETLDEQEMKKEKKMAEAVLIEIALDMAESKREEKQAQLLARLEARRAATAKKKADRLNRIRARTERHRLRVERHANDTLVERNANDNLLENDNLVENHPYGIPKFQQRSKDRSELQSIKKAREMEIKRLAEEKKNRQLEVHNRWLKGMATSTYPETNSKKKTGSVPLRSRKKRLPKMKGPSNKKVLRNALQFVLLAGLQNQNQLEKVTTMLESYPGQKFLILFSQGERLKYKGLYFFDPDVIQVLKVCGEGPDSIVADHVKAYYKYSTAQKEFLQIVGIKAFTSTVDGVSIKPKIWKQIRKKSRKNIL